MPTSRPDSAPDFLLSRGDGSVRTQGALRTFDAAWEAADAIARGEEEMIVGALPFDQHCPAALTVPERIVREPEHEPLDSREVAKNKLNVSRS